MSLANRVAKLERRPPAPDGRCPACPPGAVVIGYNTPGPACPRCGRPPGVLIYLPEKDPVDDPRVAWLPTGVAIGGG